MLDVFTYAMVCLRSDTPEDIAAALNGFAKRMGEIAMISGEQRQQRRESRVPSRCFVGGREPGQDGYTPLNVLSASWRIVAGLAGAACPRFCCPGWRRRTNDAVLPERLQER